MKCSNSTAIYFLDFNLGFERQPKNNKNSTPSTTEIS